MRTDDRLLMEKIYTEMYQDFVEEDLGLGKKLGLGTAALGLAYAGPKGVAEYNIENDSPSNLSKVAHVDDIGIMDKFNDPNIVSNAIKEYFKQQRKDVDVVIRGDDYIVRGDVNSKIPISVLRNTVDMARVGKLGKTKLTHLAQFLNERL